jgi:hypothetical protein
VYHVQVVLVRPDRSLVEIAQVKSSNGGELKMVAGGWELDVPQQTQPADGKLTLSAFVKEEFLRGSSTLVLVDDYYPHRDNSAGCGYVGDGSRGRGEMRTLPQ